VSPTALVDPSIAVKIGKIVAAEGLLIEPVAETPQALEMFVRFVGLETAVVLAAEGIYGEDLTSRAVGLLIEGLALKLGQRFRLLEGVVVKAGGKRVFVALGSKQAAQRHMKLILIRE
jgi:hypothetical protein